MEDSLIVIQAWKDINVNALRNELDANQVIQIKALKAQALLCRKQLNESTKAYRSKHKDVNNSNTSDTTLSMAIFNDSMELLKQYQDEVDRLSKRSKYSEASFMDLFKTIQDAPDPVPCLDTLMKQYASSTSESRIEIDKLRSEIEQYDAEFSTLKNQDIKIQR